MIKTTGSNLGNRIEKQDINISDLNSDILKRRIITIKSISNDRVTIEEINHPQLLQAKANGYFEDSSGGEVLVKRIKYTKDDLGRTIGCQLTI